MAEFLHNLTFQALSKENDDIFLSFDNTTLLVLDMLEHLEKLNLESINETKIMNKNIKEELDKTLFAPELTAELEIQEDLENVINNEKKIKFPPSPTLTSTPLLSKKQAKKTYDDAKKGYLKTAMTINKTDLDAEVENADKENEKIISDVIDPTSGLFVDDKLNLEDQFKEKSNVIERSFNVKKNCNRDLIIF